MFNFLKWQPLLLVAAFVFVGGMMFANAPMNADAQTSITSCTSDEECNSISAGCTCNPTTNRCETSTGSICTDFGVGDVGDKTALGTDDAEDTVYNVINIILSVLGIIAVILIIYGGLLWMTAAGDDSKIQKAKQVIYAGIIGLLIIMASFAIANFVVRELASSTGTGG